MDITKITTYPVTDLNDPAMKFRSQYSPDTGGGMWVYGRTETEAYNNLTAVLEAEEARVKWTDGEPVKVDAAGMIELDAKFEAEIERANVRVDRRALIPAPMVALGLC